MGELNSSVYLVVWWKILLSKGQAEAILGCNIDRCDTSLTSSDFCEPWKSDTS